jgi:nicotinate-nucleotide pyrophosphorylase
MDSGKYFLSEKEPALDPVKLESIIKHALIEDIGRGDITTSLTIPKEKEIHAEIILKENCVI